MDTSFCLAMNADTTETTRKKRRKYVPHGTPDITIRYDSSKDTWVLFNGSDAIGYTKGSKRDAELLRDAIQKWNRIQALMFLHLRPTLSEKEREAAKMQRALIASERRYYDRNV